MSPDESLHDGRSAGAQDGADAVSHSVLAPAAQTVPLVFASPHSGDVYTPELLASSRLAPLTLRRSEDAFVDRLYASVPAAGAPLLKAHFPRVFIDANREPFELDPEMFGEPLPDYVNQSSPRVASGLGTIARVVANGEAIYAGPLDLAEALHRIETHYVPYHRTLQRLLDETFASFDCTLLIDCHSMPSIGGPMDADPGLKRVDFVLGDCHGTSCAPAIIALAETTLRRLGFSVRRNLPYAGGYTTRHYGRPRERRHALQIEVNRALYMNEIAIRPTAGLQRLAAQLGELVAALAAFDFASLRGR